MVSSLIDGPMLVLELLVELGLLAIEIAKVIVFHLHCSVFVQLNFGMSTEQLSRLVYEQKGHCSDNLHDRDFFPLPALSL